MLRLVAVSSMKTSTSTPTERIQMHQDCLCSRLLRRGRLTAVAFLLTSSCVDVLPAQGPPPATIETARAELRSVKSTSEYVATLVPSSRVTIGSAVSGRVLAFAADAGKPVAAGEELAKLRTATIEIELAAARAELKLRLAELELLENGSLPEEKQQSEARLAGAMSDFSLAEQRLKRAESLQDIPGAISIDELDIARFQMIKARQNQLESSAADKLVQSGPRAELVAQASARADVQREAVRLLEDRILKYIVRTPFAGFVVTELTEAGAWLQQGDPVAEVIAIDPIEVEVFVPQTSIEFIRPGDSASVAIQREADFLTATVKQIVPQADRRTRMFPVVLQLANAPNESGYYRLRPGMTVRVKLPTSIQRDAVVVPKDAVVLNGQKATVYKVVDGKVVPVDVKLGAAVDGSFEVSGEISDGDEIVTKGNERLRGGQSVKAIK